MPQAPTRWLIPPSETPYTTSRRTRPSPAAGLSWARCWVPPSTTASRPAPTVPIASVSPSTAKPASVTCTMPEAEAASLLHLTRILSWDRSHSTDSSGLEGCRLFSRMEKRKGCYTSFEYGFFKERHYCPSASRRNIESDRASSTALLCNVRGLVHAKRQEMRGRRTLLPVARDASPRSRDLSGYPLCHILGRYFTSGFSSCGVRYCCSVARFLGGRASIMCMP